MTDTQKWFGLALVASLGYVIYLLSPIVTPFMISVFLAYLGSPLVSKLESIKFSRTVSVLIVGLLIFILALCCLFILIPLVEEQIRALVQRMPSIISWVQDEFIPMLLEKFGLEAEHIQFPDIAKSLAGHWSTVGDVVGSVIVKISQSGQVLLLWLSYILLIPIVTFYLLRDWERLIAVFDRAIPKKYKTTIRHLAKSCDVMLAEFLRGQLSVMAIQSILYSFGLWLVGLEFSLLIGLLAGLVSFIPYVGVIVGVSVASVAAFMQFHDFIHIFYVVLVFGVGQLLEGMVLSPLLIGDRIGLHPVAVIFSVMAGAHLFGILGMLLALPLAAVITVLLRYFHDLYLSSQLYHQ